MLTAVVKLKFFIRLIKHWTQKRMGGVGAWLLIFFISALDGDEWLAWCAPSRRLHEFQKQFVCCCPYQEPNSSPSVIQSFLSYQSDCTNPATFWWGRFMLLPFSIWYFMVRQLDMFRKDILPPSSGQKALNLLIGHKQENVQSATLVTCFLCLLFYPNDICSTFLRNVGKLLLYYTASHARKQLSL
jgi:hypothetical protein